MMDASLLIQLSKILDLHQKRRSARPPDGAKPASLPLPTRASRIGNNPTKLGFSSFFLGRVHD
jgi:hypothetical protein